MQTDTEMLRTTANQRELTSYRKDSFPCAFYIDKYYSKKKDDFWRWHEEVEIGIVKKGQLVLGFGGQKITLNEGDGILLNSRVLHKYQNLKEDECIFYNIVYHPSCIYGEKESVIYQKYMKCILDNPSLSLYFLSASNSTHKEILGKIEKGFELLSEKKYGYEWEMRDLLSDISRDIFKDLQRSRVAVNPDFKKVSVERERVSKIINYIEHNLSGKITAEEIADTVSVSVRECQRSFRNITGKTIMQVVIELRVKRAEEMLRYTEMSVGEISELCGFNSASYFVKTFREMKGIAPASYRKKYCIKETGETRQ